MTQSPTPDSSPVLTDSAFANRNHWRTLGPRLPLTPSEYGDLLSIAEVKAANVKLNEENAALRKQIAGLTPVVTSGSYMQDAAEAFAAAKKDGR